MVELFHSGDPDQMPHSAASDLGLHCLLITLLGVSRLKWVKNMPLVVSLALREFLGVSLTNMGIAMAQIICILFCLIASFVDR